VSLMRRSFFRADAEAFAKARRTEGERVSSRSLPVADAWDALCEIDSDRV